MSHYHAVVWLDHHEARVFHFNVDEVERTVVHPDRPTRHLHHRRGARSAQESHPAEDAHYYASIAQTLASAEEILVVGPSTAKLALMRHLHRHGPAIEAKVVAVETVDHPSDGQLVAYARKYFRAADRLRPQAG